jgi:hypothetical protein
MKKPAKDPIREERIHEDAIVDAYGPDEKATSWYYYLESKLAFPFMARCIVTRLVSPLKKERPSKSGAWLPKTPVRATCLCGFAGRAAIWQFPCHLATRIDLIQVKGSAPHPPMKDHMMEQGWGHIVFAVPSVDRTYAILKARGVDLPEAPATNEALHIRARTAKATGWRFIRICRWRRRSRGCNHRLAKRLSDGYADQSGSLWKRRRAGSSKKVVL